MSVPQPFSSSLGCLCWRLPLTMCRCLGGEAEQGKACFEPSVCQGAVLELSPTDLVSNLPSAVADPGCCHPACSSCPGTVSLGGKATAWLTLPAPLLWRSSWPLVLPNNFIFPVHELHMPNSWSCSQAFYFKSFCLEASSEFLC